MWNSIGLILNMGGIFIILTASGAVSQYIESSRSNEDKSKESLPELKLTLRTMWFKIGMILLIMGFFTQLIGSW